MKQKCDFGPTLTETKIFCFRNLACPFSRTFLKNVRQKTNPVRSLFSF